MKQKPWIYYTESHYLLFEAISQPPVYCAKNVQAHFW